MDNTEPVIVTRAEHKELSFRAFQIQRINEAADKLENGELDAEGFADEVLNIL